MPLQYDDVPGSWGKYSENWPSLVIPLELVEEARKTNPHYPVHVAHVKLCREARVPYGCSVTVEGRLRVETEEYLQAVKRRIKKLCL